MLTKQSSTAQRAAARSHAKSNQSQCNGAFHVPQCICTPAANVRIMSEVAHPVSFIPPFGRPAALSVRVHPHKILPLH